MKKDNSLKHNSELNSNGKILSGLSEQIESGTDMAFIT